MLRIDEDMTYADNGNILDVVAVGHYDGAMDVRGSDIGVSG